MRRLIPLKPSRLREIRKQLNLSQWELAHACFLTQTTISQAELGYRNLKSEHKEGIAKSLGFPVSEVFPETEE